MQVKQSTVSRKRFTSVEKSWICYDWANSVYATIIMAAVFPIYFANVAGEAGIAGDVYWGVGTSIATFTVAILAPIMGAIADFRGMKKKLFTAFLLLGLVFTTTMALTDYWQLMLIGYVLSYIGFSGSLLFYDSFITDITTAGRMDRVSAWGYAMGYIGGSTIPFILSIALIMFGESIGIDGTLAVKLSCLLCVFWWAVFSIPMLKSVKQVHYVDKPTKDLIGQAFRGIVHTLRDIVANKAMLVFMAAYFFYIDGVNTVIHMATVYGSSLGLGSTGMILALLVTQLVAVPCSIAFSHLARRFGTIRMITFGIVVYLVICLVGFYMGFSLEPHQDAYTDAFTTEFQDVAAQADLTVLSAVEQKAWTNQLDELEQTSLAALANPARAEDFAGMIDEAQTSVQADTAYSDAARAAVTGQLNTLKAGLTTWLADTGRSGDFDFALKRSSFLFWAMAALVGTCQGGIQALSRSFFGKLIPPQRSSEFFGFFDIFGKFAAVIGPALYAFMANLTGRSSFGILSLILLFAIGLGCVAFGQKHLRVAEANAMQAEQNQEES